MLQQGQSKVTQDMWVEYVVGISLTTVLNLSMLAVEGGTYIMAMIGGR